ncbi:MAG: putative phage abortive infection protein [Bacteroidota bacterium]
MTTFILLTSIVLIILGISTLAFTVRFFFKKWKKGKSVKSPEQLNWQTIFALLLALLFIVVSFTAPLVFTRKAITDDFNFAITGQIGDTIGGLMNPFIALAGVIVTGLAFYMQYRANRLQKKIFDEQVLKEKEAFETQLQQNQDHFEKQFQLQRDETKRQRFHDQFYEMLRLHKENVNEIEIAGTRRIVNTPNFSNETYTVSKREAFVEFVKEFEIILKEGVRKSDLDRINKVSFGLAYEAFFWGVQNTYVNEENRSIEEIFNDDKTLPNVLIKARYKQFALDETRRLHELRVSAFEGHSGFLGHYFRHLYHTVKFVANQPENFIQYEEKMEYLKVLRAQLSNHEQIMLFYNWLSGYGAAWENNKHRFLTEYCMIHNLWYDTMIEDDYIKSKIDFLRDKDVIHRQGPMFEIDDKA